MNCPTCGAPMDDVTDSWHTFSQAEGAEYLAAYVTIWHCPVDDTVVGTGDDEMVEWVMDGEPVLEE